MGKRKVEDPEAAAVAVDDKAAKKKAKKEKKAKKKAKKEAAAAAAAAPAAAAAASPSPKKEKKEKKDKSAKKAAKKAKKAAKKAAKEAASGSSSSDEVATKAAAPAEEAATPVKAAPAAGNPANNPDGITRVFVGNLSWSIDEDTIRKFAEPGVITDIHWVTEKDTGKFLGRGFLEFENAAMAGAFLEKAGESVMDREIRIDLAQPRQNKNGAAGGARTPRPLSAKPDNCTTVFLGNLSFDIDEDSLTAFLKEKNIGDPVNIRWLTDRDTGAFRGCGFVEFADTSCVDKFVELNGVELLGRGMRIDYAEGRKNTPRAGGGGGGGRGPKPMSEKPEGCTTVFLGNLSFDIEDDDIHAKAKELGAGDVKHIRWLTDRESGEFKGCGFVEFHSTEDVDKFATLNGQDLKGRSLRVDYAKPRAPRE